MRPRLSAAVRDSGLNTHRHRSAECPWTWLFYRHILHPVLEQPQHVASNVSRSVVCTELRGLDQKTAPYRTKAAGLTRFQPSMPGAFLQPKRAEDWFSMLNGFAG